ncbi:MAG: SusC/RagA family TonB-linked outer membrane protein [Bacteroidota bacterium]
MKNFKERRKEKQGKRGMLTRFFIAVFCGIQLLFAVNVYGQQEVTVSGTVTDAEGQPLPGVTVVEEGTTNGTVTNNDGVYTINVPGNATLVFSFVGMSTEEVEVGGQTSIDVTMEEGTIGLEEVVAIGYGTMRKSDLTGSISSVSNDDIMERPIIDAAQALQGRASGLVALSSGSRPGDGVNLTVRGRRSLTASNNPLFVVDGIPLEGGINDINPQDIESMEVLKDASATAIYGSRGANGVVLVTTKRGGNYQTTVNYSGYVGIKQISIMPDMMNAEEFARMKEISGFEFSTVELNAIENGISTDWLDLVTQDGFQQNHQLSIRGGDRKTQFAISTNYMAEEGVIKTQDFTRSTLRINLDHIVSEKFKVGTSTQLSRRVQNRGDNVFGIAVPSRPTSPAYNEDGSIFRHPGGDDFRVSPLVSLEDGAYVDERSTTRLFSNIFGIFDITSSLNYRLNFGVDLQNYRRGHYQNPYVHSSLTRGHDLALKDPQETNTYTLENILKYTKSFGENHELDLTGLYSFQISDRETSFIQAVNFPYEHQLFHNIGSAESISAIGSSLREWSIESFMGRFHYQLMNKYLLTLTGRFDGSSRLAEGNKWFFFPSAALAWRISDESFMASQNIFSSLRLRVSYGTTGNTAISPYQTQGGLGRTVYSFNGNPAYGYRPNTIPNPELRWESSASFNVGLDYAIINNRVSGSFEIYQTNTSNLLLARTIPITSGYNSVMENIGETQNQGFEIILNTINVDGPNFNWTTNLNFFGNNEEIVKLLGTGRDDIGNRWFIGEPLTVHYNYEKLGIWQLDEAEEADRYGQEPGEIKVKDLNDDGIINDKDMVILGTDIPKISLGFGNRLSYKEFELSFFLFGSFGHMIKNHYEVGNSTMVGRYNNLNVDYWTPDNPTNEHPKPDGSVERPLYNDARGYSAGDFLKVRNIQLAYNFPKTLLSSLKIQNLRVFLNAETPFMFTKVDHIDPERWGGSIGSDTPSTKLFSMGVNIDF